MVTPQCPHCTPGPGADRTPLTGDRSRANCSAHCSVSFQLLTGQHPKGVQRRAGNPGRQQTDLSLKLRQRHTAFLTGRCSLASALCCDSETRTPRLHSSPPSSPEHHPFPMPGLHHERSGKNSHERSGKNSFQKPFCLPSPTSRRLSPQMIPKCPFLHLRSLRQGTSEASPRQVTTL